MGLPTKFSPKYFQSIQDVLNEIELALIGEITFPIIWPCDTVSQASYLRARLYRYYQLIEKEAGLDYSEFTPVLKLDKDSNKLEIKSPKTRKKVVFTRKEQV